MFTISGHEQRKVLKTDAAASAETDYKETFNTY